MRRLTILCLIMMTMCVQVNAQNSNEQFPSLTANLLSDDKEVIFPDFLQGKKAMITLVFEQRGDYKKAQSQSDNWQDFWGKELEATGVEFYEIPMMSGIYWIASSLINSGMRSGIAENLHDNVACFYGKKMEYATSLGITDISETYVCLIDEQGNIIASQTGEISEEKKQSFLELVD